MLFERLLSSKVTWLYKQAQLPEFKFELMQWTTVDLVWMLGGLMVALHARLIF